MSDTKQQIEMRLYLARVKQALAEHIKLQRDGFTLMLNPILENDRQVVKVIIDVVLPPATIEFTEYLPEQRGKLILDNPKLFGRLLSFTVNGRLRGLCTQQQS